MNRTDQTLESYEKGSITAEKMRVAAAGIKLPKQDDQVLSPHRDA